MNSTRCAILLIAFLSCAWSFKILIYSPLFGNSHAMVMGRLADILVEEGMDVTALLPKMNPKVPSNGTKLAKTIAVEMDNRVKGFYEGQSVQGLAKTWTAPHSNPLSQIMRRDRLKEALVHQCEHTLSQKDLLKELKDEKFDLGIRSF